MKRRLASGSVTLGVAAAVVAAIVGSAFAVQRASLHSYSPSTKAALRASRWLERYRLVDSTITLDGGAVLHGRCLQDWFHTDGRRRRGAVLHLDDGYVLLAVPPHTLQPRGGTSLTRGASPLVLMELAGCPRVLARRMQTLAQQRQGLTLAEGNRLGFDLEGTKVTLLLDARTDKPVGVRLVAPGASGSSQIRFSTVTKQLRELLGVSDR